MSENDKDTRRKAKNSESYLELDRKLRVDNTKDRYWDSKQKLIKMCQDLVGTISPTNRPLNIAIIGPPGCGKSSLLNTIFASFSDDRWNEVALSGSFGKIDDQCSKSLIRYLQRCGDF